VVTLAAWLLPGAGHFIIGQRSRGLTIGISILVLFVLGLLIGGMRVVDMPSWNRVRQLRQERQSLPGAALSAVMEKPWYVGQFLAGPVSIISARTAWAGDPHARGEKGNPYFLSHARSNEIGTLYTAVAGMLNLLAIIDATYRAARDEEEEA
jgi:hypothetical protein